VCGSRSQKIKAKQLHADRNELRAYDKVCWEYLLDILEKREFGGKWIEGIRGFYVGGL
jgi:hypothetical protein